MKARRIFIASTIGLSIGTGLLNPASSPNNSVYAFGNAARFGNSIGGFVFDPQRQPIGDAIVELMDDYSRSIGRTRTNSSGRYLFSRLPAGRFRVRVLSVNLNYEEQEQEVEIQNLTREVRGGGIVTGAYENAQKDFYLKPRRENQSLGRTESVFVQEIPQSAKAKYDSGVDLLNNNKKEEGLKNLKSAIEIFPDYYAALDRLGGEYVRLKHFLPAQVLLTRAVEVNPRSYRSWYSLAYALYSQNKMPEALEAIEKANSLNQLSVESALLSGVILKSAGRYEESEKQLKRAKDLSKNTIPDVHWRLALLYGNHLKRYREAANELEIYLKLAPDSKDAESIKKLIAQFKSKAREKTPSQ